MEHDPNGMDPHAPGAKLDGGKVRPWLMISGFARALNAVAEVTTKGAAKYTDNGWAQVPNGIQRYMEGFARHQIALGAGEGEVYDEGPTGTGCLHKAQMIWNLLASLELELRQAEGWERRPSGPTITAGELMRALTEKMATDAVSDDPAATRNTIGSLVELGYRDSLPMETDQ